MYTVESSRLENMHFLGNFNDIAPKTVVDELTSANIEQFIRSIVTHDDDAEVDPAVIEEALKGMKIPMTIVEPHARMMAFGNDFFESLKSLRYRDFRR